MNLSEVDQFFAARGCTHYHDDGYWCRHYWGTKNGWVELGYVHLDLLPWKDPENLVTFDPPRIWAETPRFKMRPLRVGGTAP